jgi:hypothetical protein
MSPATSIGEAFVGSFAGSFVPTRIQRTLCPIESDDRRSGHQ